MMKELQTIFNILNDQNVGNKKIVDLQSTCKVKICDELPGI